LGCSVAFIMASSSTCFARFHFLALCRLCVMGGMGHGNACATEVLRGAIHPIRRSTQRVG
jgi:hypothetical protein